MRGRLGRQAGMTLLELLLVMAILAIALGGGLGMFSAIDVGKRQAVGLVKNTLRTAKDAAVTLQSPARVRIDKQRGVLLPESLHVIGTWHFENGQFDGAFGLDGEVNNVRWVTDGYLGDAIDFGARLEATARVGVEFDPAYDFADGFALDCAVRMEHAVGGRLLSLGGSFGVDVNAGGAIRGWFRPAVDQDGREQVGSEVVVLSDYGALPPERWVRVRLEYDRRHLVLYVDGVPLASVEEDAEVWKVDGPLRLSDAAKPFPGSLDNLVISTVVAEEPAELPETVRFGADTPSFIAFDAGGGLDRRVHPEPLSLVLEFDDGAQQSVFVGRYGTVE
jgi:prepilin-type N-terminal cleavage/methylation domain-containing protein